MMREKKLSRNGALKVLDFALSGQDGKENCNKFVDILGLRTVSYDFIFELLILANAPTYFIDFSTLYENAKEE